MAGNYRVKVVFLIAVLVLHGGIVTGNTLGNEPFISLACDNGIYVSPTDELSFNKIADVEDVVDSAYDPANGTVYFISKFFSGYVDIESANVTLLPAGCPQPLARPLGMEDGRITDDQITASSVHAQYQPYGARLNSGMSWASGMDKYGEYIQVVFNRVRLVSGVITQGYRPRSWVATYEVQVEQDNTWQNITEEGQPKVFPGNTDSDTPVTNMFPKSMRISAIRILPKTWNGGIYLRMEILGCDNYKGISYDYETEAGLVTSTISRLNVASGRLYERSNVTESEIAVFNAIDSRQCSYSYTYEDPDEQELEVQAADVDMCGRTLHWLQRAADKSKILRRHLDDFYGSTIENLYYNDGYAVNDLQIYNGSVYFVHTSDGPGGPVLSRLPLSGGEPEALQCLADVSACNGIYIFDPTPPPPHCEPSPYLLKAEIPVIMGRLWRGGFIAHMEIHITVPLSDWHIEIYFPNRVYELEIEGCDAKILEKYDVNRGRYEKGTAWVLIPGPKSTKLDVGDKIRVKFIGRTNPSRRGFVRKVFAKFYRLPVIPPCD